jgi:hypothetical protein
LSLAAKAQDTADNKRRVFVNTPTAPYDVGDLWNEGQAVKRATVAKAVGGVYSASDWKVIADTAVWTSVTGRPTNTSSASAPSGTAVDGGYAATVTGVDTFTVTQASRTTSGNVNLFRNTILSSFNVSYVVDGGAGVYSVVLINAMPDANYALAISSVGSALAYSSTKTSSYFSFVTQSASESSLDSTNTSAVIFR